jgi:hypothetical protein
VVDVERAGGKGGAVALPFRAIASQHDLQRAAMTLAECLPRHLSRRRPDQQPPIPRVRRRTHDALAEGQPAQPVGQRHGSTGRRHAVDHHQRPRSRLRSAGGDRR